jgi:hypothetical protein
MNRKGLLILIVCFSGFSLQAQKAKKDTIQRDIIMEKEYRPEVTAAEKIRFLPDLENTSIAKEEPEFLLSANPAFIKPEYLPLPAPGVRTEFPSQQQLGYLRLGAGSKLSFVGDAQVNLLRSSKQTLDIRLLHKSIFGEMTNSMNVKDRAYMNKNRLMANYKLNMPGNELAVCLSEKYNSWNYYGSWQTPLTPLDNIITYPDLGDGQWSSDTKFSVLFKSRKPEQVFTWSAGVEGHLFRLGRGIQDSISTGNKGGKEKEIWFFGNLNYVVSDKFQLGIDANLKKYSYTQPDTYPLNQEYNINPATAVNDFADQSWLELNPYAKVTIKHWSLMGGLRVTVPSIDTERIKYNIIASASAPINDKIMFKANLDGGIQTLSYREGFEMNPYLDPFTHLQPLRKPVEVKVGLDYRPSKSLRVSPVIGYDRASNMPFFYNGYPIDEFINQAYGRIFSVKYMKSNKFYGGTDVIFNYRNKINLIGQLRYNHYVNYSDDAATDMLLDANGRKAWHMPAVEAKIRLEFSPIDIITVYADYQLSALRYAATTTSFSDRMDDIHDINVGITWKVTRDVNVFLHIDNILDQRYELWNNYKSHGLSAMIGGSVHF